MGCYINCCYIGPQGRFCECLECYGCYCNYCCCPKKSNYYYEEYELWTQINNLENLRDLYKNY